MSEKDKGGSDNARSERETPKPRPPAERDITEGYRPPSKPKPPAPTPTKSEDGGDSQDGKQ